MTDFSRLLEDAVRVQRNTAPGSNTADLVGGVLVALATKVESIQQGGGSFDADKMWQQLGSEGDRQIHASHINGTVSMLLSKFDDYVSISGDQTVTGSKTFSAGAEIQRSLRLSSGGKSVSLTVGDGGALRIEGSLYATGGITAYGSDEPSASVFDALPIDGDTIYWQGDVLKAKGGSDFNTSRMWQLLGAATAEQIALQHLTDALSGYATQGAVTAAVQALDVSAKGGAGKYIKSISQTDGKISASEGVLDKSAVGLGNVDNTSDASKRVAYAAASGDADTLDGQHASYFTQLITAAQTAANTAGSTANAAKTKIDSLQVGGRNIFLGTGTADVTAMAWIKAGYTFYDTAIKQYDAAGGIYSIMNRFDQWPVNYVELPADYAGAEVTLSFECRCTDPSQFSRISAVNGTAFANVAKWLYGVTEEWQQYSATFTLSGTPMAGILIQGVSGAATHYVYIRRLKLERGNIATDWTPAPEDGAPKLTKSRMLWGQPFDGTADVTGSMTIQGDILATGGVTAYTASDRRLKTDISGVSDAVRRLRDMGKVYEFAYIEDVNRARHIGMMWQEVREAMPQMCHEEGGYGRLNYLNTDYLNLLNAAIQELAERVERIEERLEERRKG